MEVIVVIARRRLGGWELEIGPERVTHTKSLGAAPGQVREYLSALHPERDYSLAVIDVYEVET